MEEEEEEESCQSSKTRGDADGVPGAREKEGGEGREHKGKDGRGHRCEEGCFERRR